MLSRHDLALYSATVFHRVPPYFTPIAQFVRDDISLTRQLAIMGAAFFVIATTQDSIYILLAARLRAFFQSPKQQILRDKLAGIILFCAGCGMFFVQFA